MIRIDLHTHSCYSKDSRSTLDEIIRSVPRSPVHGIALTDHDQFEGAIELKKRAPFPVIQGEEIKTQAGEIIGLFLKEWVPPKLTPLETVQRIKEQGGLVYVPHPFDRVRKSRMTEEALDTIVEHIDLLEVFNARNARPRFNVSALEYSRAKGLKAGAGSDAHTCGEYGAAYIELPRFDDAKTFLQALPQGTWHGRLSSPLVHVHTRIDVLWKRLYNEPRAAAV